MTEETTGSIRPQLEAVKLFNEFQAQSRARAEATLKLVMGVSGGMLTLSVGAMLGPASAKIPVSFLPLLEIGLVALFSCVAASMLLMASMIVATFHMGVRWRKALEDKTITVGFIATWNWLRIANGVLALLILCSFVSGVGLIARVAIGIAETTVTTPDKPVTQRQVSAEKPNPAIAPVLRK